MENAHISDSLLTLDPFTKEKIGMYQCLAYNLDLNLQVSRRINLNAENKFNKEPTDLDISDRISIEVLSGKKSFRKNGNISLQCTVG